MTSYFKYHILSGHIDSKIVVIAIDHLEDFLTEGYSVIETDKPFGGLYVDSAKEIQPTVALEKSGGNKHMNLTENVIIDGLPADSWVRIGNSDPVKTANGSITIAPDPDGDTTVEVVGKYAGGLSWFLKWEDIANIKIQAKKRIDRDAETVRSRVATLGAGQAMTYLRKAEAARQYLNGATLTAPQMQRLEDEATRLEKTVAEAAASIVELSDKWETFDAAVDHMRLETKILINAATTGTEIATILSQIAWPH